MKRKRTLVFGLLAILLSACSQTVAPEKYSPSTSIGPVTVYKEPT